MAEPTHHFHRPSDPTGEISLEVKQMLGLVGECYRRALDGDIDAISDLVLVAHKANEALERLEQKHCEKLSLVLRAAPAMPANFQDGAGDIARLVARFQKLKVTSVRSDTRRKRAERPDPENAINKAARQVRRFIRRSWDEQDEHAKQLGALTKKNAADWFRAVGWDSYLNQCDRDVGKDSILGNTFEAMVKSALQPTTTALHLSVASHQVSGVAPTREQRDGITVAAAERERQRVEKDRRRKEDRARSSAARSLRGQVRRAFIRSVVAVT